jgi:hypothetical protein
VHLIFGAPVLRQCPFDRVFREAMLKHGAGMIEDQRVDFAWR